MALYLTYRPRTFADVIGQDHIVTTLEQAVEQRRLGHAYLFSGTRGTGKTSVARILARSILHDGVDDPAQRALLTKAMDDESLVDFVEIDAASTRGIDDIRDLIAKVAFRPSVARAKVYLIDEVHMLTKEAFNALLKTLEEPPDYAYFILATTELHKVPETIQSRCQRFLFRRVKDDDIVSRLQYIVDQEKITIDREALRAIARHASGSFRDGIALLDQLSALPKITAQDVAERTGNHIGTLVEDLAAALTAGDSARISEEIAQMEAANTPADLVASGLLRWARTQLHDALEDDEEIDPWIRTIDALLQTITQLRNAPLPSLVLEASLLKLIGLRSATPNTVRETSAASPSPTVPAKQRPATKAAPTTQAPLTPAAPVPSTSVVQAEELTAENLRRHWDAILRLVTPASVRMSLKNATLEAVEGTTIRLTFDAAFHRDRVREVQASRTVEEVIGKLFRTTVSLECSLAHTETAPSTEAATDLAEAAAEVFGK